MLKLGCWLFGTSSPILFCTVPFSELFRNSATLIYARIDKYCYMAAATNFTAYWLISRIVVVFRTKSPQILQANASHMKTMNSAVWNACLLCKNFFGARQTTNESSKELNCWNQFSSQNLCIPYQGRLCTKQAKVLFTERVSKCILLGEPSSGMPCSRWDL